MGKKKTNYKQGIYTPENPEKWVGDIYDIVYRSSWERKMCKYFDRNPNILQVSSEEIPLNGKIIRGIPYFNPFKPNKFGGYGAPARYFIDFWIKYKKNGKIYQAIIEIKPSHQTKKPKEKLTKTGRMAKSYLKELQTFEVNKSKWAAAKEFAKANNMLFFIITECDMGLF